MDNNNFSDTSTKIIEKILTVQPFSSTSEIKVSPQGNKDTFCCGHDCIYCCFPMVI